MHLKPFIKHISRTEIPSSVPITPAPWPEFPPCQKPSSQSPYRTVLWFHRDVNNGVRILVEGRDEVAVNAYAKIITDSQKGQP